MTKRYKILRKKLQQLESDLSNRNSFFTESNIESLESQFGFLNKILSAEIESSPSKPRHLSHISRHLAKLRDEFDARVQNEPDPVYQTGSDPVEIGSGCSCTDSCLNDDQMDSELDNQVFYDFLEIEGDKDEEGEVFFEADLGRVEAGRVGEEIERCGGWDWGNDGRFLASGIVIGAVLMGILGEFHGCLSDYYYGNYYNRGFLVPT